MKSAIEQSIKEKIKALSKERGSTFAETWRNLILERFLTRLSLSPYKENFILKGGTLLAKYIHLGRETQDLDFFIQKLANTEQSLRTVLQVICDVDANDSFSFEIAKIKILDHSQLAYTGAEITLQALFGATKTVIRMDLGFGDRVDPIEHPINLTATSKGPLFESGISLHCYPKEFIFAEKLETIVFRGGGNTRMKDFHDLYSLVSLNILNTSLAKKTVQLVFHHRKTPLKKLSTSLGKDTLKTMEKNWSAYHKKIKSKKGAIKLPESIEEVVSNGES
ncbi:MAG TPA: nucleotidyl transferase AbiEii/AbiGii toxin family protein, partial [Chlamydiales bacterium]|nr:nucleotidyl transferase AbiEii/AbiGii toxin family protein [Chlamydiales bacterium]